MRCNVGGIDRIVRLALGGVLVPAGLFLLVADYPWAYTVLVVGSLVLASGALGFCPPYLLFGISTARQGSSRAPGGPAKETVAR